MIKNNKDNLLTPPLLDMGRGGSSSPVSPSVLEAGSVSPSVFTKLLSDRDRTCDESWIDVPCESVLADLSEDLQAHVNSFLGAKDLCSLAEVSQHFHRLSSETESWFPLLRSRYPFIGQLADLRIFGVDVGASVKHVFLSKRRQAVQRVKLERSQFYRTKLDYFLHVFSDPCLFIVIFGLVFWGALSVGLSKPPFFTSVSLLPFYVLLIFMFTLVTSFCCARHCAHGSETPYSPFSITAYARATGVVKIIMNRTLSDVPFNHAIAYGAFCSFCLFWLLFFLRISSVVSLNYAVVFVPLFLFFAAVTTVIPFLIRSDTRAFLLQTGCTAVFIVIPALAFSVLMFCKLWQGFDPAGSLPMKYVMMPLFILDFFFLCVAVVGAFYFRSFAPVQIFVGLIGPYAVFEYLMTVMLDPSFSLWPNDTTLDWSSVFIPLLVGLGLEFILALALSFATYSASHHNPSILCARPPRSAILV